MSDKNIVGDVQILLSGAKKRIGESINLHDTLEARVGELIGQNEAFKTQIDDMMKDVVDGALEEYPFRDVVEFHEKFDLAPTEDPENRLPDDVTGFRLNFLLEELLEYAEACGFMLEWCRIDGKKEYLFAKDPNNIGYNQEVAFDSLIDLVYVALGDAYLRRFPFNAGWRRVQAANMAKVRATSATDSRSKRQHANDIVKPTGWTPPDLSDLVGLPPEHMVRGNYLPPPPEAPARQLISGKPIPADYSHTEINLTTGMQKDYVVLSPEERAKGFIRPVRNAYRHGTCGVVTKMGPALAETYARDPWFYSGTFCSCCRDHFPLHQFRWDGTDISLDPGPRP